MAKLISCAAANTKVDLVAQTGLSRSAVGLGLQTLAEAGLVRIAGQRTTPGRGRPADRLEIDPRSGVILAAEYNVSRARVHVYDMGQRLLASRVLTIDMSDGPEAVLGDLVEVYRDLTGSDSPQLRAVGLGLPGPIDTHRGVPVRPPVMPGWDGYPVADFLSAQLQCDVVLENDVNLRALGEARALPADQSPLLYVLVDVGIGGGLVQSDGQLYEGSDGAAGDIGHIRVAGAADVPCVCGQYGCLEAVASASAMAEASSDSSGDVADVADFLVRLRHGDERAVRAGRESAAVIGGVIADLVHFANPARVVIGGPVALAHESILSCIRGVVYDRALPLATRNLAISGPVRGVESGVGGALVLAIERALGPAAITRAIAGRGGHDATTGPAAGARRG
ncbi:ROK family protein [Microbacterium sp. NPDC056736]|uniref:ROK family protein n=1 Tax=Microbacterium sp. NPDC056736 TaxID=3345932 RepID=UPI003670BF8F